jgi:hypothetical protein
MDLDDAREKVEEWRAEYSEVRLIAQLVTGRRHVETSTRPEILS